MKNEENLKVAAHYKNKLLNKKNIKIKINKKIGATTFRIVTDKV